MRCKHCKDWITTEQEIRIKGLVKQNQQTSGDYADVGIVVAYGLLTLLVSGMRPKVPVLTVRLPVWRWRFWCRRWYDPLKGRWNARDWAGRPVNRSWRFYDPTKGLWNFWVLRLAGFCDEVLEAGVSGGSGLAETAARGWSLWWLGRLGSFVHDKAGGGRGTVVGCGSGRWSRQPGHCPTVQGGQSSFYLVQGTCCLE